MQSRHVASAALLGVILAMALTGCAESGTPRLQVRGRQLVGRELRLLLTTSRHYRPTLSHSSRVTDVQEWLLIVDLASDRLLDQRSRLLGPLWESTRSRSFVSFDTGALFTSADERAAREAPGFTFDGDGALLRFKQEGRGRVRERLDTRPSGPSWTRLGAVQPLDDRTEPFSEDRVESVSGRHVLIRQNGGVRLFDQFTGEPVDDGWLTAAFDQARRIPDFENVRYFLADDLNHLVVNPVTVYNKNGDPVRTFDWRGRTFVRAETVLVFSRPTPDPILLARPNDEDRFRDEPPNDAFVVDGQLRLFDMRPNWLRLYGVDGRDESRVEADGPPAWPIGSIYQHQHLPATSEIALWDQPEQTGGRAPAALDTEYVFVWNYRRGSVTRYSVPVGDLFEKEGAHLRPRIQPVSVPR